MIKFFKKLISRNDHLIEQIEELKETIRKRDHEFELLSLVLDQTPCHIYWKDRSNHYLGCNTLQANTLGLPNKKYIKNKSVFDLIEDEAHCTLIDSNDQKTMEFGIETECEEPLLDSSQKKTFLSFKKPLRNQQRKIIGMVGVSIDISKQKELEEQLQEALDASKIDQDAKDVFITNLSHDIRTPITGMLGLIDILKSNTKDHQNHDLCMKLETLTKNFLSYFNEILNTISGPENMHNNPVFFDIAKVIHDISGLFEQSAEQKGVEIQIHLCPTLPKYCAMDELIFKSILANLLGNAVKFTQEGHIEISANYDENEKMLILSLKDTGIGIPSDHLDKIFDRFTSLNQSCKSQNTRSGLGLYMVKKHLDVLNGTISVTSELDVGSTFEIQIPITHTTDSFEKVPANVTKANEKKIDVSSPLKTLIIEDTPLAAMALKHLLVSKNFIPTVAVDGQSALKALDEKNFDIIFLDLGLPDIDGIELLDKIKDFEKTQGTYIVVLSGHINPDITQMCIHHGADAVYAKPFTNDHFKHLVKN